MQETKTIQSIDRAIEILKCFCESDPLGITDLSRLTGLHKSTTSNIVLTLEANGFLRQDENTRKYELGTELCHLAANVNVDIRKYAYPYICAIRDICGETVNLGVHEGMNAVYLDSVKSQHSVCSSTVPGTSYPIFAVAFGRAMMAFLPEFEREQLLDKVEFTTYTENTLCDLTALREMLTEIRRLGYAINWEETEVGHTCIAAPVLDSANYPVASICVSGPTMRFSEEKIIQITDSLLKETKALSESLGCRYWQ